MPTYYFPFGQPLHKVEQEDKSHKSHFVLGVYASAVHARWLNSSGEEVVAALAVASEPSIFWTGENAAKIIASIKIPSSAGSLSVPRTLGLNGPSGRTLDEKFLKPLVITRADTWLCDLLPESRLNPKQKEAIRNNYTDDFLTKHNLPKATVPEFTKTELDNADRRQEILEELEESRAHTLILLGDLPIKWFLRFYADRKYSNLSQFGNDEESYGRRHKMTINGRSYDVIPLCHPRQAGGLGMSSTKWKRFHDAWVTRLH